VTKRGRKRFDRMDGMNGMFRVGTEAVHSGSLKPDEILSILFILSR